MINKYAAVCFRCGQVVHAGAGDTNLEDGRWKTGHITCPDRPIIEPYEREDYGHIEWTEADWADALNPNEGSK